MELAALHGLMAVLIRVSSMKIILKEREYTSGVMGEGMKASGRIIRWRAMECSRGLMVESTRENTLMIRKKEMEYSSGPMGESMKEIGKTVSSME
jgi:hypothetical protein